MRPNIIVTGFANSGTSFLTELVVRMGFSPGSHCHLKVANRHNPHGYWEHLPMRCIEWQKGSFRPSRIPSSPYRPNEEIFSAIVELADQDDIEVYKATTLPWTYPWFGAGRAVLIKRSANTLYERYYKREGWSVNEFRAMHTRYYDLAAKYLDGEWDVLWVEYEGFADNLLASVVAVCEFLGRPFAPELLDVWRPRC